MLIQLRLEITEQARQLWLELSEPKFGMSFSLIHFKVCFTALVESSIVNGWHHFQKRGPWHLRPKTSRIMDYIPESQPAEYTSVLMKEIIGYAFVYILTSVVKEYHSYSKFVRLILLYLTHIE